MILFSSASRISLSFLANTALLTVSAGLAVGTVGLTALYLAKYIDETPAMRKLQCLAGLSRPYCIEANAEVESLKAKLAALALQTAAAEKKLNNLRAIESSVDTVTLFETYDDPNSSHRITVGTVYSRLLEPDLTPQYFCYVSLGRGDANEDRNLHFQSTSGPISLTKQDLRKAGISDATLEFGHSVCKPLMIGQTG